MPHIFRFHTGRHNNIFDWGATARITPQDLSAIPDRTTIFNSSAGTSIPTPLARMFLFKTGFDIIGRLVQDGQIENNKNSIYAGLVSETLDLLELLYTQGNDPKKFEFQTWTYDINTDIPKFGEFKGHMLLEESFKQAASQEPFNGRIEFVLIFFKEGNKRVLAGATSPFTFVFTSPNFKRKMKELHFKSISGNVAEDILFDSDYKMLHERDGSFIKYIEELSSTPHINQSFNCFTNYITYTRVRYPHKFNTTLPLLRNIQHGNIPLLVQGINLKQISEESYKEKIEQYSDFKIELPTNTKYDVKNYKCPLFLLDKMKYSGQYISPDKHWTPMTKISENQYPENSIEDIKERELPNENLKYPFFSDFDFFEHSLVKLPGYILNDERFICVSKDQTYLLPLRPLFFHLFPIETLKNYLKVHEDGDDITFILSIPIHGPNKGKRSIECRKTYNVQSTITYSGILGIFPITKAIDYNLRFTNKYSIAAFEKTNVTPKVLDIKFFKDDGIGLIPTRPIERSNYSDINTKSTYYNLDSSFSMIQLNFERNNSKFGGIIIPKFKEIKNGTEEYVYAIDFGTSNTHVHFGRVDGDGKNRVIKELNPFTIDEKSMQMTLLNKPKVINENDGTTSYNNYEEGLGTIIDSARQLTLREFVPFQIGSHKGASVKFPFRTATCESQDFISDQNKNQLFLNANIGFNIDQDATQDHVRYKTDLKWLLSNAVNDPFNRSRISLFFHQLLLMIRTKVLLEESTMVGDIRKLQIALSFPISMSRNLRNEILNLFNEERKKVLGEGSLIPKEVTESIAPFYQLKSEKPEIQNDSFCNIDIGGGTTDIVLIDRNPIDLSEINCYCASFRFAGKQLWSSSKEEYNQSENGFLSYYKHYIERLDKKKYESLKSLFNSNKNSTKTEDIIGLLFSDPNSKFPGIFIENKEFKTVLILHYAAILFYITKLAKYLKIEIPRTISFSGKGSEYLNLIFPINSRDLLGFTLNVLRIFADSTQKTRPDFEIKRNEEPKTMTAKGSTYFSIEEIENISGPDWNIDEGKTSTRKRLKSIETIFYGFRNESFEGNNLTYEKLESSEYFNDILDNCIEFLNLIFDNKELCNLINKALEIRDFGSYKKFFIPEDKAINLYTTGILRDNFLSTIRNMNPKDVVSDIPFFFPFNHTLIQLSRHIASQNIIKK